MKILETARLTDIVFHGTSVDNAISILKQNKFLLAFSKIAAEDKHSSSTKYHFFLSTARSKTSAYLKNGNQPCIFVLDGRKLSQRYSGKAVNYWSETPLYKNEKEKEDRIFSKNVHIPQATSYIKELQISIDSVTRNKLKALLLTAKNKSIPIKVYRTFKGLLTNKPSDLLNEKQIKEYIKGVSVNKIEKQEPTVKPEEIAIFTYGYAVLEEAVKKEVSFTELLKSKRYEQTRMRNIVGSASYLLNHIAPYSYSDFRLETLMSNARRRTSPQLAKEMQKVSQLMRTLKVTSVRGLQEKFFEKRQELEKILSEKQQRNKFNSLNKEVSKIIKADMQKTEEVYSLYIVFDNATFKTQNTKRISDIFQVIKRRAFFLLGIDMLTFKFSTTLSKKLSDTLIHEGFNQYKNEYSLSSIMYRESQVASDAEHREQLNKTGFWGKQGAGCLVFAKDTKRFLIGHRSRFVEQPNSWGTFGGAIDTNETPQKAIKRELKEETTYSGLVVFKKIYTFRHPSGFVFHNFIAIVDKEFTPKLDWENQNYKWVQYGDWPDPLHFGMKNILKDASSISLMKKLSGLV